MVDSKIIKTINQNRKVKPAINPKARQRSENIISTTNAYVRDRPKVVQTLDTSDMAIWDSPETTWDGSDENDKWDTYDESTLVISRVMNKNNRFVENFDYDFFKGGNTTATWSTANGNVSFTSGQVLEVLPAFKDGSGTELVTSATLTSIASSGSYDYEMSADGGSNWESVTLGALHIFTNTGSDLRIRVTENNSSTGVVDLIVCTYTVENETPSAHFPYTLPIVFG